MICPLKKLCPPALLRPWVLALAIYVVVTTSVTALSAADALAAQAADTTTKTATTASVNAGNDGGTAKSNAGSNNSPSNGGATNSSTNESEINATVEPPTNDGHEGQPKALLNIRLYVPQMLKRTDSFMLNPYSTPPPPVAIQNQPLPENIQALAQKCINSGYNNRLSMVKPYPDGGWRWYYVYKHAKLKSGITEPHAFFQMYRFGADIAPYCLAETKRLNKIEKERNKRYFELVQANKDNQKDEEMEALRNGLEPVKLNLMPTKSKTMLETSLYLSPGDWWITGSHRVPGLIYFWQEPIKVHDGDKINIDLTDANAILIQGGW